MNQHRGAATAFAAGLLLLPALAAAQARPMTMEEMHKLHQDPKVYMAMLDDPARDAWQKPHEVVMALGLKEGDAIADIGAGTGYFAFRFAHHVGATGQVYAVDVSPDMILHMNRQIPRPGPRQRAHDPRAARRPAAGGPLGRSLLLLRVLAPHRRPREGTCPR